MSLSRQRTIDSFLESSDAPSTSRTTVDLSYTSFEDSNGEGETCSTDGRDRGGQAFDEEPAWKRQKVSVSPARKRQRKVSVSPARKLEKNLEKIVTIGQKLLIKNIAM